MLTKSLATGNSRFMDTLHVLVHIGGVFRGVIAVVAGISNSSAIGKQFLSEVVRS